MMWNYLASGIGVGATIVLFDGNPAHPDLSMLWHLADELELTYFGTSAPFLLQCRKEELVPRDIADLSGLRALGSTGAPLPAEGFRWVYEAVNDSLQLASVSGGTDVCSAFVGAAPTVPVYAGEISCRSLGCAVEAFDETGRSVVDELGELVITASDAVDAGRVLGRRRRVALPRGVLRRLPGRLAARRLDHDHRSRHLRGHRPQRRDAEPRRRPARHVRVLLRGRVPARASPTASSCTSRTTRAGPARWCCSSSPPRARSSTTTCAPAIAKELRTRLSPRHVPDEVHAVPALPRTLSGKKLEVPVKKILRGAAVDDVAAKGALTDPDSLDVFAELRPGH